MFSIGEFSKITSLPVKTLRFYHEKGLLVPARIEPETGYRYVNGFHRFGRRGGNWGAGALEARSADRRFSARRETSNFTGVRPGRISKSR